VRTSRVYGLEQSVADQLAMGFHQASARRDHTYAGTSAFGLARLFATHVPEAGALGRGLGELAQIVRLLDTAHGTRHTAHNMRHIVSTFGTGRARSHPARRDTCAPLVDVLRHVLHEGEGLAQIVVVGVRRVRVLDQILHYIIIN
jgi:hypothetical protein